MDPSLHGRPNSLEVVWPGRCLIRHDLYHSAPVAPDPSPSCCLLCYPVYLFVSLDTPVCGYPTEVNIQSRLAAFV
jgi:hypothetical protein